MKLSRLAAAICLSAVLVSSAQAADNDFSFGQTSVKVRADDSFCPLDGTYAFDKAWLDVQVKANAGNNEVVGAFLLCTELAELRDGVSLNLSEWIILLGPSQGRAKASPLSGYTRAQIIELLAVEFDKGVKADLDQIHRDVDRANKEILGADKAQPIEITGDGTTNLLATTPAGVFAGLKLSVASDKGQIPVGAVLGMTLVNEHLLSVNVYRQFNDPKTINVLLVRAMEMVGDVVKLNP